MYKEIINLPFLPAYFLDLLLVGIIFYSLLILSSIVTKIIGLKYNNSTIDNLKSRINSWWIIIIFLSIICLLGKNATIIFFFIVSFISLKEFFNVLNFNSEDKIVLNFCLYVVTPLQYFLIYIEWYQMFIILIPVYSFLFLPVLMFTSKSIKNYLQRLSTIQWGLIISVFCISHISALTLLEIKGYEHKGIFLVIFLLIVSQVNDTLQYIFGKIFGKHKVVPTISPNKTLEGYLSGLLGTGIIACAFWWITPFNQLQAFFIGIIICLMGNVGGLVMSSIKRDYKIKDWSNLIKGHGGITDRIDSICFSAPIFFHIVRYYWS